MPASYSSPARNFFLLGSSGDDTITNFFRGVDKSAASYNSFTTTDIQFNGATGLVQEYGISGWKHDSTSSAVAKEHGWIENRTFNLETFATSTIFDATISSTVQSDARVNDILFTNGFIYACGYAGDTDFIAKYNESSGAVIDFSTSNTGDNRHTKLTVDPDGNIYCAGYTENGDMTVVKYNSNTIPLWSKVIDSWNDSKLESIALAKDGNPIAVGWVGDESHYDGSDKVKGYILKLNKDTGDYLWDRTLEDNLARGAFNYVCDSYISDVTFNDDGEMFVVGFKVRYQEADSGFIVKYDEVGNMMWQSTSSYTTDPNPKTIHYRRVKTDSDTGQTITVGEIFPDTNVGGNQSNGAVLLSKYSSAGQLLWRREVESNNSQEVYEGIAMDADSTFYYLAYTDQAESLTNSKPDRYVFGKVSTSGNGLGAFQYDDQEGVNIDYTYNDCDDQIGKLSDGSVRNDTSDLITYPFTATKLVFDDLATQVQNKKAQIARAGTFQMSGSPAVRVSDFKELAYDDRTISIFDPNASSGGTAGEEEFTLSTVTYSNMLTSGTLKTEKGGFTAPFNNVGAGGGGVNGFRSEGVGGLTFTPTNPIPYSTKVEVLDNNNVTACYFNQTNNSGSSTQHNNGWVTVATGSGTITSMFFQRTDNNAWDAGFCAIKVDDYILFDGGHDLSEVVQQWTAPAGVTSVSVVVVGAGGAGGGALAYKNNITVTPGANYNVTVGAPGYSIGGAAGNSGPSGGFSQFVSPGATVVAEGGYSGSQTKATRAGQTDGGGDGGYGYNGGGYNGGGAGGYSGDGGNGDIGFFTAGSGGGGAGGDWAYNGGGGVGLQGEGASGTSAGQGGSGGGNGDTGNTAGGGGTAPNNLEPAAVTGGLYGGGYNGRYEGHQAGPGAVRIIWPGDTRQFPSTLTADGEGGATSGADVLKVKDITGRERHGTIDGATLAGTGLEYWEFDGSNDKIVGPPCNTILSADSSIELWVSIDDDGIRQTIISGYDSTPTTNPDRWDFEITDGRFRGGFHDNGYFTSLTLITPGDWNHVMLVLNSSTNTLKFYLNGVENVSQSCSGFNFGGPDVDLGIGDRNESSIGPFDGKIGEVRIYQKALTAAQVFQNYNATKNKYINQAPVTAPKIGPGIVTDSTLLLNYDFGNRATYDDTQNYLLDNFAADEEIDQYLIDDVGEHEIYYSATNINSAFGGSQMFSPGTYDVSVSMWMKADDFQTNQFALKDFLGAPVGGTYSFTPKNENPDGAMFSYSWTNVTFSDSWNFGVYNNNGDARTMLYARPQLTLKPSTGRYVKAYGSVITPPTTVKNLSSDTDNGTLVNGVTFNSDGYFDFGGVDGKIETALSSSAIGNTFSAEVWIYPTDFSAPSGSPTDAYPRRIMTCHRSVGSTKWCLGIDTSGRLGFGGASGVEEATDKKYQLSLNTYYHVVLTHEELGPNGSPAYKIYVNGTEQVDQPISPIDANHQSNLAIGGRPSGYGDRVFEGRIAQARIYNVVLSDTEVSQNFNATRGKYGV